MVEIVHVERPFVDTNGHTLGLIGTPPGVVKANLAPHTVKWAADLKLGVVTAVAPLSWPLVVQTLMGGRWPKGLKLGDTLQQWIVDEIDGRLPDKNAHLVLDSPEYRQPPGKEPWPYQMDAAAMLSGVSRGFLWDDPGTGKTISAMLATLRIRQRSPELAGLPVLVVAPPSVMDSWVDAWHEWTNLKAVAWRGTPSKRHKLMGSADVYVVGYPTIRSDASITGGKFGPLLELGAGTFIADEIQAIKNPRSVQSLAARRLSLRSAALIGLSGTPISHNVGDLWPALNALDPLAWPARDRFVKRYLATTSEGYGETIEGFNDREPEFRLSVKGQMRRKAKEDVLKHLPPKMYSVRYVDLPPDYLKAYRDLEVDMVAQLPDGGELSEFDVVTVITRLLQLSCAAADVHYTFETRVNKETGEEYEKRVTHLELREPSWKIDELMEVADERQGRHGLVFSPSAKLIRLAAARLEREGYRVGTIIGGQTPAERTAVVDGFQAGDLDLVCATTDSGGVGLTLTRASYVVFLQRPWSHEKSVQAEDRAHRMGSEIHNSIEIIDIRARDTIDERVVDVIMGKAGALAELYQDPRVVEKCLGNAWARTHQNAPVIRVAQKGDNDDGQRGGGNPRGKGASAGAGRDEHHGERAVAAEPGSPGAGVAVGAGQAGDGPVPGPQTPGQLPFDEPPW